MNKLIGVLRGAASIMRSRERLAADAAAGKCTITNLRDIKPVNPNKIPPYVWDEQDRRGGIVNMRYWMFPWPRRYDARGHVIGYDPKYLPEHLRSRA